ncbi:hypothetical protein [Pelagibacterium montanilacus]|uniref:hypothetical protein n=1 Tax=Pelagibacterium montanilacus TaxID=2185280 RepID=UPI000F8ED141|nr:hypothetical protein [Pelagibacterium montanilacus]
MKRLVTFATIIAIGAAGSASAVEITVPMGYNPNGVDPTTMECTVPGKVTTTFTDRNGNTYVSCTSAPNPRKFIDSKLGRPGADPCPEPSKAVSVIQASVPDSGCFEDSQTF